MFQLLGWLYDKASRVYAFFGWMYDRIRDAALNAYNWAVAKASDAFWNAYNWVLYYYNRAKDRIAEALDNAISWAIYYFNLASDALSSWVSWLVGRILYWYNRAVEGAQALVNGVIDLVYALFTQAVNNAINLVNQASSGFQVIADLIADGINQRINQVETTIDNLRETLNLKTPEGVNNLTTILSDPIGWIYALLYDRFTDFLCFQLAKGLGTVKYELPPAPVFGPSKGGEYPGGYFPPGSGILTQPLTTLRISGYTFNNPVGHMGIDFGLNDGDPVYAMHDGKVITAGWSTVGYGFQIVIRSDEWWSRYAHCRNTAVTAGMIIEAGQLIGSGDSTGNSTGPHLHLELKRSGRFIDPLSVL